MLGFGIIKGMFGKNEEKEGSEISDIDIKELYEQVKKIFEKESNFCIRWW